MERSETLRDIELQYGNRTDGQFGVAVVLKPEATVTRGDEVKPGMVLLPWECRALAYALLHHAEWAEHGGIEPT